LQQALPDVVVICDINEFSLDEVLVSRALSTLVRNAREAGAQHIQLRATAQNGGLSLCVMDNGRGFPPEILAHALEPFARGGSGSGLGLAFVVAVARAHGGDARILQPGPGGTIVEMFLEASPGNL
jgi:two-component system sensor histidine kinase TctE